MIGDWTKKLNWEIRLALRILDGGSNTEWAGGTEHGASGWREEAGANRRVDMKE